MQNRKNKGVIWRYLWLQIKKDFKIFPTIMLTTIILVSGLGSLIYIIMQMNLQDDHKQKVNIGIVGEATDSYLGIGIQALQHLDSSRFMVTFQEMAEEEAKENLEEGKLSAYVVIPDGFVESVLSGQNEPITYVTASGVRGITSTLMDELVKSVSTMITESQNGIYGMQHIMVENGVTDNFWENTNELNLKYIKAVLNRTDIYDIQILGYGNQLSFIGFYVCGMVILFLLLWGINGSHLLIRKDNALTRVLVSKNINVSTQIVAEYIAYFLLMSASLLCVGLLVVTGMELTGVTFPEWEKAMLEDKLLLFIKLLPVAVAISAMQFFLYELISGMISGILLQFTVAIGLGYLSGCFYPVAFFPDNLQNILQILPTATGVRYVGACLLKKSAGVEMLLLIIYSFGFLLLAGIARKKKLKGYEGK